MNNVKRRPKVKSCEARQAMHNLSPPPPPFSSWGEGGCKPTSVGSRAEPWKLLKISQFPSQN